MSLPEYQACYSCVYYGNNITNYPCAECICNGIPSRWTNKKIHSYQYVSGCGGGGGTTIHYQLQINPMPLEVKDVIFNYPATVVFWSDGTKTVVKCAKQDEYDAEKGLAIAICKKFLGDSEFKHTFKRYRKKMDQAETGLSCFNNWVKSIEPAMQKFVESLRPFKEVKKNET